MTEFQAWPSTPRLYRDCTITEKIDGTNACVIVTEDEERRGDVLAQSRKRIITPEDDNFGFARWVHGNADGLKAVLGPGYHFGEWYGQGIQRNYGLTEKRFALFNTHRWAQPEMDGELEGVPGLEVVPIVATGVFSDALVGEALEMLTNYGSYAADGFMRPEGIVVWHSASRQKFKVLIENDDIPKSLAEAA